MDLQIQILISKSVKTSFSNLLRGWYSDCQSFIFNHSRLFAYLERSSNRAFPWQSSFSGKIFSDPYPIWEKQGKISVKHHYARVCLIYIPCEMTRKWVLDVGFWHSGNCSFTISLWSSYSIFTSMKLVHASIWVLF